MGHQYITKIAQLITEDPDVPLTEGRRIKDALSGLTRELMKQVFPKLLQYYKEHDNKSPNLWPTSELLEVDRKRIYQAVQNPIAKTTLARLKYYGFDPGRNFKAQWDPNFRIITINPEAFASGWSPRRETWERLRRQIDDTVRHELEHTHQSAETEDSAFQDYIRPEEDAAGYLGQPAELEAFASQIARQYFKAGKDPQTQIRELLVGLRQDPNYNDLVTKLTHEVQKRITKIKQHGRSKKKRKEQRKSTIELEKERRRKAIPSKMTLKTPKCDVCGKPTTNWHEDGYYYCGCDD